MIFLCYVNPFARCANFAYIYIDMSYLSVAILILIIVIYLCHEKLRAVCATRQVYIDILGQKHRLGALLDAVDSRLGAPADYDTHDYEDNIKLVIVMTRLFGLKMAMSNLLTKLDHCDERIEAAQRIIASMSITDDYDDVLCQIRDIGQDIQSQKNQIDKLEIIIRAGI
jgi:hypothetical protein